MGTALLLSIGTIGRAGPMVSHGGLGIGGTAGSPGQVGKAPAAAADLAGVLDDRQPQLPVN